LIRKKETKIDNHTRMDKAIASNLKTKKQLEKRLQSLRTRLLSYIDYQNQPTVDGKKKNSIDYFKNMLETLEQTLERDRKKLIAHKRTKIDSVERKREVINSTAQTKIDAIKEKADAEIANIQKAMEVRINTILEKQKNEIDELEGQSREIENIFETKIDLREDEDTKKRNFYNTAIERLLQESNITRVKTRAEIQIELEMKEIELQLKTLDKKVITQERVAEDWLCCKWLSKENIWNRCEGRQGTISWYAPNKIGKSDYCNYCHPIMKTQKWCMEERCYKYLVNGVYVEAIREEPKNEFVKLEGGVEVYDPYAGDNKTISDISWNLKKLDDNDDGVLSVSNIKEQEEMLRKAIEEDKALREQEKSAARLQYEEAMKVYNAEVAKVRQRERALQDEEDAICAKEGQSTEYYRVKKMRQEVEWERKQIVAPRKSDFGL
jgi:hypothetical protein